MLAASIGVRCQMAGAVFGGEIELLSVFKQKSRTQIRAFGAIKPADGPIARRLRQLAGKDIRLATQILQISHHGCITHHIGQAGNALVESGILINRLNDFMKTRCAFRIKKVSYSHIIMI